jgi:hypothetical protein
VVSRFSGDNRAPQCANGVSSQQRRRTFRVVVLHEISQIRVHQREAFRRFTLPSGGVQAQIGAFHTLTPRICGTPTVQHAPTKALTWTFPLDQRSPTELSTTVSRCRSGACESGENQYHRVFLRRDAT